MITHDELIYCIQQQYPDAVHGQDFWVGMPIDFDGGTNRQLADAMVLAWRLDGLDLKERDLWPREGEPSADAGAVLATVAALAHQHGEVARVNVLAMYARQRRNHLLLESDGPYLRAQERGEDLTALLSYRNALRDLPEQPGFPETIVWPELPAT